MPNKQIKILLIDDSATAREHLTGLLKEMGHSTTTAENGRKALELMQNKLPDLVICDLVMPDMDGIELLKQSKNLYPDLPFLIITAHASLDTAIEALRAGADDYIMRPVETNILALRIETAMSRLRLSQEISQRKMLEAALATVGGLSHEINQPLMAIMASAELVENINNIERIKELAKVIIGQTQRISILSKRLSSLERFETMDYPGPSKVMDIKASSKDTQ